MNVLKKRKMELTATHVGKAGTSSSSKSARIGMGEYGFVSWKGALINGLINGFMASQPTPPKRAPPLEIAGLLIRAKKTIGFP